MLIPNRDQTSPLTTRLWTILKSMRWNGAIALLFGWYVRRSELSISSAQHSTPHRSKVPASRIIKCSICISRYCVTERNICPCQLMYSNRSCRIRSDDQMMRFSSYTVCHGGFESRVAANILSYYTDITPDSKFSLNATLLKKASTKYWQNIKIGEI